eukprot:GGOE01018545.1.p1 GENE.GGOE01018545.1~~GGOE01018545.1.p1  ORF type:complete len:293 (-),score=44.13 GGOE01018545.1:162-995(-)
MAKLLLIFDFSGTLSWSATQFGRSRRLAESLQTTGLASCGLQTAAEYFKVAVEPSWQICSTTKMPFARALADIVLQSLSTQGRTSAVELSCDRFVTQYVQACRIHPAWGAFLPTLPHQPSLQVVLATDHYFDVTDQLAQQVRQWFQAEAHVIGCQLGPCPEGSVLVANSALAGDLKSSEQFWAVVKESLPSPWQEPAEVLLVDDFGHNEGALCDYSRSAVQRQQTIVAHLKQCFPSAKVASFPFLVKTEGADEDDDSFFAKKVSEACHTIDELLARS